MAVFNFPYHTFSTEYSESGTTLALGNSYEFTSEPVAPNQRMVTLNFSTMIYYVNPGDPPVVDVAINPLLNMGKLEAFYKEHELWKSFDYYHPVYGTLRFKFAKPLKIPEGNINGGGSVKPFSLMLREQP